MSEKKEWYLEYEIIKDRPGLLGDISSLLGMLSISVVKINSVDNGRRGLLIVVNNLYQIKRLQTILHKVEMIKLIKLREPKLRDRLAVRHGRYIQRDTDAPNTFQFIRSEIGLLVDFMSEVFKEEGHKLIGIRGMPRVGKTESIVAASVSANKRWLFISSTLLKQTLRTSLIDGEYLDNNIYIIDGAVSVKSNNERHWQLIREVIRMPVVKVIEHPDIFIQHTEYTMNDFDYIIELKNEPDEVITYDVFEQKNFLTGSSFGDFGGFDF